VMELAPLIAAKRLDFSLGDDGFKAQAHAGMLGELLRNLLANAIHHAPERAQVGIVLRRVGSRRELIVWDDGPGIDDALRPRLFQPFAAGKGGLGLGLSICRQIAEAMGADVQLHNRTDRGRVIGVDAIVSWRDSPS
jgi:two-component system, OmpR family, sensor histidine kinase TctE